MILDQVLNEEKERINRVIEKIDVEISECPKGYISQKKIKGKVYSYLQRREGKKIISAFISQDNVEACQILIERRKELEKQRKELKLELQQIEKALPKRGKNERTI